MKKITCILCALSLLGLAAWAWGWSGTMVVGGGQGAAAEESDSCTGALLFAWHAENMDVTLGGVAGGVNNGCSVGDTSATAVSSVELSTTQKSDGSKSVYVATSGDYYEFDYNSTTSQIINPNAGTIDFYFYSPASLATADLFYLWIDASNRIYISLDSGGYISVNHVAGGTQRTARTEVSTISTSTMYHCKVRWDTTAHGGYYLKVTADTTTGESNNYDSGTDALGTWVGTSGTVNIGDKGNNSGGFYLDQIKIYNSWQ